MQLPKLLQKYSNIISDYSDERGSNDGIWVYLKDGFINTRSGTHCVHEDTIKECTSQLQHEIKSCKCIQCKE